MNHLGEALSAFLDGELVPAERAVAAVHLAECSLCQGELAGVEAVRAVVRGLPVLEVPAGLLPASRRRHRRWMLSPGWVTACAAALAITVGLVVGPGESGPAFQVDTLNDQHIARVVGDPGVATFRGDLP